MRTKTAATELRVGMIAFLPYFGKLLKSKITHIHLDATQSRVAVRYEVLSEPLPRHGNQCFMKSTSKYEVYKRGT